MACLAISRHLDVSQLLVKSVDPVLWKLAATPILPLVENAERVLEFPVHFNAMFSRILADVFNRKCHLKSVPAEGLNISKGYL